jgi:photosystem II stability/assembly factor-like uncharacterized protein
MAMNKTRILNLTARIGLFALILSLGTLAALVMGETEGLALADLSGASVQAVAIASSDDVVYASMTGGPQPTGIYRSDDNGRTWQVVSPGPGLVADALAVDPTNETILYAGTAGGPADTTYSLWFSDNSGQTWHKFPLSLPTSSEGMLPGVTALAVDPDQPDVLYVGTDGHGVYRFATEWDNYGYELLGGLSLNTVHVNRLVVGPQGRLYALTNDGLFVTDGDAWQTLSLPEQAVSLAVAPDDPEQLYAGCVSTGLYRSTDGGQTWERLDNGLDMTAGAALRVTALAVDEGNPRHVVAATAYGVGSRFAAGDIYESQDRGHTWNKVAEAEGVVTQLTINQNVIYAATSSGLARYGTQAASSPTISLPDLSPLANPSGVQVLILVLTAALAGLALTGRGEWVSGRQAAV